MLIALGAIIKCVLAFRLAITIFPAETKRSIKK